MQNLTNDQQQHLTISRFALLTQDKHHTNTSTHRHTHMYIHTHKQKDKTHTPPQCTHCIVTRVVVLGHSSGRRHIWGLYYCVFCTACVFFLYSLIFHVCSIFLWNVCALHFFSGNQNLKNQAAQFWNLIGPFTFCRSSHSEFSAQYVPDVFLSH